MTKSRKRLLYYSDCPFFAGCENMLANFLSDERILEEYDVYFAFRESAKYLEGIKGRVLDLSRVTLIPVNVIDPTQVFAHVRNKYGSTFFKCFFGLWLLSGLFLWVDIFNTLMILKGVFHKRHFDIIHINNGGYPAARSALAAALAARIARQGPVVMVVNNIATPRSLLNALRHGWWNKIAKHLVTRFVTASRVAAAALQQTLDLNDSQITSLHNGIGLRPSFMSRNDARSHLGLDRETIAFGIVAILEPRKGHRVAIEALAILARKTLPQAIVLLIEGNGPDREVLKHLVTSQNLSEHIVFVGSQANIMDFYQSLDVVLAPSIANEDFPNVVLEAMGLGIPVIGTSIAGIPEQIKDGETGFVVSPSNASELASRMHELVKNPTLRSRAGEAGRQRFQEKFSNSVAVSRYLELYKMMIEHH